MKMLRFFDAHTHVQFSAYDKDRNEVIKRAFEAGVGMVNVGTQKDTSRNAVELAKLHNNLWAAVGLHPTHASTSDYHDSQELGELPFSNSRELEKRVGEEFDYEYYKNLALDPKVLAIGECGLDYFRLEQGTKNREQIERQKEVFFKQIKLAHEVKKPLMIHCRNAFGDLIEVLNSSAGGGSAFGGKSYILNSPPGIIHFFSGTVNDVKDLLDLGFYFTFGGVITFVHDYDKAVKIIPIDRILSETDAPYVTPTPYRGKRNEPVYVIEVVKKLSELKGISTEMMAAQILKNAKRAFGIGFDQF